MFSYLTHEIILCKLLCMKCLLQEFCKHICVLWAGRHWKTVYPPLQVLECDTRSDYWAVIFMNYHPTWTQGRHPGTERSFKVLVIWAKFLEASDFYIVSNSAINFEVFWLKSNSKSISSWITLRCMFISATFKSYMECTTYENTNYNNTTNHSGYLPQFELLLITWYTHYKIAKLLIQPNILYFIGEHLSTKQLYIKTTSSASW